MSAFLFVSDAPSGGGNCFTAVLHAGTTDASKPSAHYWVEDVSVLEDAKKHFRLLGYDDIAHTVFASRNMWTTKYGSVAPLEADNIRPLAQAGAGSGTKLPSPHKAAVPATPSAPRKAPQQAAPPRAR